MGIVLHCHQQMGIYSALVLSFGYGQRYRSIFALLEQL
jgi:hypothetical protein